MIGFYQNTNIKSHGRDLIEDREFKALKSRIEGWLNNTNRFLIAQSLTDREAEIDPRKASEGGVASLEKEDVSKMIKAKYILRVVSTFMRSHLQSGRQGTEIFSLTLNVSAINSTTKTPIKWFKAFEINASKTIQNKLSRTGFVLDGTDTSEQNEREKIHNELVKEAALKLIAHIYKNYPTGDRVTDIKGNKAKLVGSNAVGLLDKQEMVIYARLKDQQNAIRIPLYNATITAANDEDAEMEIWRKNSDDDTAVEIIKMIRNDWNNAQNTYDFFAVSNGIAEIPSFIDEPSSTK